MCYGCGECCKAVQLNVSMKDMLYNYNNMDKASFEYKHDITFVHDHMKYISPIDIWRITPDVKIWGFPVECNQFDRSTRTCKMNLVKPFFCDKYWCDKIKQAKVI